MTHLELARELLEEIDQRREARIRARDLGEWQTELNEVARVLHYILAHLEPADPTPRHRDSCWADDVDDYY